MQHFLDLSQLSILILGANVKVAGQQKFLCSDMFDSQRARSPWSQILRQSNFLETLFVEPYLWMHLTTQTWAYHYFIDQKFQYSYLWQLAYSIVEAIQTQSTLGTPCKSLFQSRLGVTCGSWIAGFASLSIYQRTLAIIKRLLVIKIPSRKYVSFQWSATALQIAQNNRHA